MNFRLIFCFLFIFFLPACAALSPASVEEKISIRAKARWDALIDHNWPDAYQYETIGYRESHTLEQFKLKFGQAISWQEVKVSKVQLDKSKTNATVTVSMTYQVMMQGMGLQKSTTYLTETWLLDAGNWWHYTK